MQMYILGQGKILTNQNRLFDQPIRECLECLLDSYGSACAANSDEMEIIKCC